VLSAFHWTSDETRPDSRITHRGLFVSECEFEIVVDSSSCTVRKCPLPKSIGRREIRRCNEEIHKAALLNNNN
jgi:hypothetical protein